MHENARSGEDQGGRSARSGHIACLEVLSEASHGQHSLYSLASARWELSNSRFVMIRVCRSLFEPILTCGTAFEKVSLAVRMLRGLSCWRGMVAAPWRRLLQRGSRQLEKGLEA